MTAPAVLFCPFCREAIEGAARCPEHDLPLVPIDRLGPDPLDPENDPAVVDSLPVSPLEPRFGRAYLALGAVLNLTSMLLPFLRGQDNGAGIATYRLALTTPVLWTLPLLSFTVLYVVQRRRYPPAMRSLRVLMTFLALLVPLCVGWAFYRVYAGGLVWTAGQGDFSLAPGSAPFVACIGAALMGIGGARFGVHARQARTKLA